MGYYDVLVAQQSAQPEAPTGGVFGFIGNLIGDVQDFAMGLGHLGAAILTDISKVPGDILGGEVEGGYAMKRIWDALPTVLKQDYATRYGGVSNITKGLYEHPLSYFLDALVVADVAGLAARIGGKIALAGTLAESTTKAAIPVLGKSAAVRVGLEVLKEQGELGFMGNVARRLLPSRTPTVVGTNVISLPQARNPLSRLLIQKTYRRATSTTTAPMEEELRGLVDVIKTGEPLPWMQTRANQLATTLTRAKAAGATRMQRPMVTDWTLRKGVDRLVSQSWMDLLRKNAADARRVEEIHKPLTPEELILAEGEYQRMAIGSTSHGRGNPVNPHGWEDVDLDLGPESIPENRALIQPSNVLDDLYNLAPEAQEEIHTLLHNTVGGENILGPFVKETEVAARKMAINNANLRNAFSSSPLNDASGIEDIVSFQVALPAWREAPSVLQKLRDAGAQIVAIDGPIQPNGSIGIRAYVKATNGLVTELKLTSPFGNQVGKVAGVTHSYVRNLEETVALASSRMAPGTAPPVRLGGSVQFMDSGQQVTGRIIGVSRTPSGGTMFRVVDEGGETHFITETALANPIITPQAQVSAATLKDLEMARAYERGLWGDVRRELEESVNGRELTGVDKAMAQMRLFVQERFHNPMMEQGLMTPAEGLDRAFRPLKMMSGAKYNASNGTFIEGADVMDMTRMLDDMGLTQPIYFPHYDIRRFGSRRVFLLSRGPHAARAMAKPGHVKLNTQFLLMKDLYVKDPVQAYIRRAAAANRWEETLRFTQKVIEEHGRPISKLDELIPGVESLYDPDGLWRFYRQQITVEDDVMRLANTTEQFDEAFAGALEDAVSVGSDEVLKKMAHAFVGVQKQQLYAIPTAVAKRLQAHSASFLGEAEKSVRLFFDTPINVWRWWVLAASPRWVLNNTLGNTYFLKMQGGHLRDVVKLLEDRWFKEPMNRHFHTHFNTDFSGMVDGLASIEQVGSGFFSAPAWTMPRLGSAEESVVGRFYGKLGGTEIASTRIGRVAQKPTAAAGAAGGKWGEFVRRVNADIERGFREASFLKALDRQQIAAGVHRAAKEFWSSKARLQRIAENGGTGINDFNAALAEVNKFFGDYLTLGPYERKIVRRFLMPFYGFYKHVTKLTARFPVEQPLRASVLLKLSQTSTDIAGEVGPVPEWLERGWPVGPGDLPGSMRFTSTAGLNPFSLFSQTPLSTLNPVWKLLYEQSTGRSSFTGKRFTAPDVVTPFGSDQQYRILFDENGNPIDAVPISKVTPSLLEHMLQQVPLYGIAKKMLGGGSAYSTADLLDVATNKGTIIDPNTGQPMFPSGVLEGIAQWLGVPGGGGFGVNLDEFQQQQADERESALVAYMRRVGLMSPAEER